MIASGIDSGYDSFKNPSGRKHFLSKVRTFIKRHIPVRIGHAKTEKIGNR